MDPVLRLIAGHRSVRSFEPTRLDDDVVRECVAAAQQAATSSNVQPYALIRVEAPDTRAALARCCGDQPQVAEAGAFFVVCAEQRRFRIAADLHDAPFEPNLETFLVGAIDASIFAQSLVLAFEAQGLGICYIGGLRNELREVRRLLELPADVFPLYGLCVGVPAEDPGTKPRLAPEAVLFHERYPSEAEQRAHVGEYDGRMAEYYAARGLEGRDWSGGVFRKWRRRTREELRGFYGEQGARLD